MKITEKFMGFQILLLQFRDALYPETRCFKIRKMVMSSVAYQN